MLTSLDSTISSAFHQHKALRGYFFTPEVSPVEQELADTLSRHTRVAWYQQVPFETPYATFYLDMGCRVTSDRVIGVECDGYQYHRDKLRDFCRDALMLDTVRLSCIYRLDAWAVRKRWVDWLRLLGELEVDLFTPDKALALRDLSTAYDMVVGARLQDRCINFLCRRTRDTVDVQRFLTFASHNQGIRFDQLVARFSEAGAVVAQ